MPFTPVAWFAAWCGGRAQDVERQVAMEPVWTFAASDAETVDLEAPKFGRSYDTIDAQEDTGLNRRQHPFFLLSGLLIFVGCYLINAAAHTRQDELLPVLMLVGVFNVYELLVLGLGVWLAKRWGGDARHEGGHLLGLTVLLMADTTFVYNELAIASLGWGAGAAALGFLMAVIKAWVLSRVLGWRLCATAWIAICSGLFMVFSLPVAARVWGGSGALPAVFSYAAWWGIAGVVGAVVWSNTARWGNANAAQTKDASVRYAGLASAMTLIPVVSAMLHLLAIHWLYNSPFTAAHVAPVMLAMSVVLLARTRFQHQTLRRWAIALGWGGVFAAAVSAGQWGFDAVGLEILVSPWRIWLLVGGLLYAVVWWRQRTLGLLMVGPVLILGACLGHSPSAVSGRVVRMTQRLWDSVVWLTPRDYLSWGITAVGLAFVLLGLGAWISSRGRTHSQPTTLIEANEEPL